MITIHPQPSIDLMVPSSKHFTLGKLSEGVFAAIANDGGWAVCNTGIIDLGDRTLVFDTFVNQDAAEELKAAAEQISGRRVDYVLNSHRHGDHVRGNQVFTSAKIVATSKTREVMAREWKKRSERIQREGPEALVREVEDELKSILANPKETEADKVLWEGYLRGILHGFPTLNLTLPEVTFESSMTFHGSERTAESSTYGGGHTESDSFLFLPEESIAFLGDLLFIKYQPYLADGDPEELFRILDKIEALEAKTIVPGHGPVGTPNDIGPMRDYVSSLQRTIDEVQSSGGDVDQAAEKPIAAQFSDWKWHSFYKENLEFLFQRRKKVR